MANIWREIASRFRTWYTRALEDEIARLRAENRAIVNSILGVAGLPPQAGILSVGASYGRPAARSVGMPPAGAGAARQQSGPASIEGLGLGGQTLPVGARLASQGRPKGRPCENETAKPGTNAHSAPLRRRSWQQIGRLREIEDARTARRERESDTETFPAPRSVVPRV